MTTISAMTDDQLRAAYREVAGLDTEAADYRRGWIVIVATRRGITL